MNNTSNNSNTMEIAETKILIMYILDKANKYISYKVYLELVTSLTDINYFDFHQLLESLISENLIEKKEKSKLYENDENIKKVYAEGITTTLSNIPKMNDFKKDETIIMYRLTAKGKEALDLTITMLPGIKKLKIDADFSRYYKSIRDAYSVSAEYLPKNNVAIFTAREDDKNLIKLELSINSEESAKKMVRTWNKKADKLYIDILNVFSNYYEEVMLERVENDKEQIKEQNNKLNNSEEVKDIEKTEKIKESEEYAVIEKENENEKEEKNEEVNKEETVKQSFTIKIEEDDDNNYDNDNNDNNEKNEKNE